MENNIQFYRGQQYEETTPKENGVVFLNDGYCIKEPQESDYPNTDEGVNLWMADLEKYESLKANSNEVTKKLGSIFEAGNIVGTTKSSKLCTTDDITVVGQTLGTYEAGTKILKGTDLLTILVNLFTKLHYPTIQYIQGKITHSIKAPTVTLKAWDVNLKNNEVLEIGTIVTLNTINVPEISKETHTSSKVEGFTYGYKDSQDGNINLNSSITENWQQPVIDTSTVYTLNVNIKNFTPDSATITNSSAEYTSCIIPQTNLKQVKSGNNTISWELIGAKYTSSIPTITSKFIVADDKVTTSPNFKSKEITGLIESAPTLKGSISIIGKHKIFLDNVNTLPTTGTAVRNLNDKDIDNNICWEDRQSIKIKFDGFMGGGINFVLALPPNVGISSIWNTSANDEITTSFIELQNPIKTTFNTIDTIYTLYYFTTDQATTFLMTINLKRV